MRKTSLAERLQAKLLKLGLPERKAVELAKGLVPVVKAEIKKASEPHQVGMVKPTKKNDPVGRFSSTTPDMPVIPASGAKGVGLLQTMDGLSSHGTYRVAAVKGEDGIVAVRSLSPDWYNVKFYPTIEDFGFVLEAVVDVSKDEPLMREHYERLHMNGEGLEWVLDRLTDKAKPKARMTSLVDRFKVTTLEALLASF